MVRFCESLGYGKCQSISRNADRQTIIKHFKEDHLFPITHGNDLTIQHGDFKIANEAAGGGSMRIWKPVLALFRRKQRRIKTAILYI